MNNEFLPLRTILKHGRNEEHPVALTADRTFTWSDFTRDVDALVRRLQETDHRRWVLYSANSYHFLTALFALFATESTAVLPPNSKQGILEQCAEEAGGALTDQSVDSVPNLDPSAHLTIEEHTGNDQSPARIEFPYLDPERPCVELFTSGSTGERTMVRKTLAHFEHDTDAEERIWGDQITDTAFFSTVSHQHIYGLLFRLLWPLSSGKPFHPNQLIYPDELADEIRDCSRDAVLATSPSHLKSITRSNVFPDLKDQLRMVVSGGGTISEDVWESAREQLGFYPLDVFGTTETGGVGWKPANEDKWRTFNNVQTKLDEEGRLLIKSPAVSTTDGWYPTGDLAESHEDSFVLGEREDRVVNIAGTRLSLPDMEAQLKDEATVDEAVAMQFDADDTSMNRSTVGVAILPTSEGNEQLEQSRDALQTQLRDVLSEHFPSVCLPKHWCFVKDLPKDQLGKPQYNEIRKRFDLS